jgi:hypothetical protein
MELLNRYLQAVGFWLPRKQKHDIIGELSEELRCQREEKESALGRALTDQELVELLKRCGPPMSVAARYLLQSPSLPPAMFMIYRFVLKVVVLWVLLPLFIIVSAGPFFAAQNHLLALLLTMWLYAQAAVFAVGMITIIFGWIARYQPTMGQGNWDPRKLPRVRTPGELHRISRFGSAFEMVWNLFFLLWWVDLFRLPTGYAHQNIAVRVTMLPAWHAYFWPIVVLLLVSLVLSSVNLVRPWWTRGRVAVRVTIDAAVLGVLLLLLRMDSYVEASGSGLSAAKAAEVGQWLNWSLQISFAIWGLLRFSCSSETFADCCA